MVCPAGPSLTDLLRDGILRFASAPVMNSRHLDFPRYTLPLIAHDYPAKTPAMWNSAYREFRMDAGNVMLIGRTDHARLIFRALRRDGRYLGGGTGVGFKELAVEHVDERDSLVEVVGSVNLISRTPTRKLRGHNTDGIGYAVSLEAAFRKRGQDLSGKTVLLLGAGGTACAVAFALAERGARLHIVNRTAVKAQALATRVNVACGDGSADSSDEDQLDEVVATSDVVLNVSTKGAGPLAEYSALGPAELSSVGDGLRQNFDRANKLFDRVRAGTIISDVVIAYGGTPLLREARARGFEVLDGVPMVINQAVEAFWLLHADELILRSVRKDDVAQVMRAAATADENAPLASGQA